MPVIHVLQNRTAYNATQIEIVRRDSVGYRSLSQEFVKRYPHLRDELIALIFETEEDGCLDPIFDGGIVLPVDDDDVLHTFEHGLAYINDHLDKWQTKTLYIDLSPLENLAEACKDILVKQYASRLDVAVFVNCRTHHGKSKKENNKEASES